MFTLKDGSFPELGLSTFRVVVFHQTVVLLLLTPSCEGQPQVIGPSQPIVALVGDDITMPCHLEPAIDVGSTAVEWTRPDLKPRFVHVWRSGQELLDHQHPSYRGRTSMITCNLKHGDMSLKLSKTRLSDKGTYRCFVPTLNTDSIVQLVFGSVSSPVINIYRVSEEVFIECKSGGWYPEPEVSWLDSEGHVLSAGPPETVRGPDDLYTVSSRVTVEKRHGNRFTCRVQQKTINQTRETQIHIKDDLFKIQCNSAVRIIIVLAVGVLSVVTSVLTVWKLGQNKTKKTLDEERRKMMTSFNPELQLLMEGDRDGQQIRTGNEKLQYLDQTKAKLGERLKKNEEELEHVKKVISTLKTQKDDLKTQRDKLNSLQLEDVRQIEKKEGKIKQRAKRQPHKKEKKREEAKMNLENRKKEHDELLESTKKLLEKTDEMIDEMTERKGKLEGDNEQINQYLKELERQIEETQRTLQSERGDTQTDETQGHKTQGHGTQGQETQGDGTNFKSGTEEDRQNQSHNDPV